MSIISKYLKFLGIHKFCIVMDVHENYEQISLQVFPGGKVGLMPDHTNDIVPRQL